MVTDDFGIGEGLRGRSWLACRLQFLLAGFKLTQPIQQTLAYRFGGAKIIVQQLGVYAC